ncbi:MAG: hypothetical protein ACREA9_05460, partial [Pyrinomonadaceae bacterium]
MNRIMRFRPILATIAVTLMLAGASFVNAQVQTTQNFVERDTNIRPIPSGAKMKFKGVVIKRDADNFTIRDRNRIDYQVLMTDSTSIRANGGFWRRGKEYAVTDILRGLIVEVEGKGDQTGQLVADKIRFSEQDMRAAITTDTRVGPVEANQERIAGQIDELYAVAAEARAEATNANERIT